MNISFRSWSSHVFFGGRQSYRQLIYRSIRVHIRPVRCFDRGLDDCSNESEHGMSVEKKRKDLLRIYLETWLQHYVRTPTCAYPKEERVAHTYNSIAYWNAVMCVPVRLRWPRKTVNMTQCFWFIQTYCPTFSGRAVISLCEHVLSNASVVMAPWKDQVRTLELDFELCSSMPSDDRRCIHQCVPKNQAESVCKQSITIDLSTFIGEHVRWLEYSASPSFRSVWTRCSFWCSRFHPRLQHVTTLHPIPRCLVLRNPQIQSLNHHIDRVEDFKDMVEELSHTSPPNVTRELRHLSLSFAMSINADDTVDTQESVWTWLYGEWASIPTCPLLGHVSINLINGMFTAGAPVHLLDKNPQISSIKILYPEWYCHNVRSIHDDIFSCPFSLEDTLCETLVPVCHSLRNLNILLHVDDRTSLQWSDLDKLLLMLPHIDRLKITLCVCYDSELQGNNIMVNCTSSNSNCACPRNVVLKYRWDYKLVPPSMQAPLSLRLNDVYDETSNCTLTSDIPLERVSGPRPLNELTLVLPKVGCLQ
jgi:hypothetical protein